MACSLPEERSLTGVLYCLDRWPRVGCCSSRGGSASVDAPYEDDECTYGRHLPAPANEEHRLALFGKKNQDPSEDGDEDAGFVPRPEKAQRWISQAKQIADTGN